MPNDFGTRIHLQRPGGFGGRGTVCYYTFDPTFQTGIGFQYFFSLGGGGVGMGGAVFSMWGNVNVLNSRSPPTPRKAATRECSRRRNSPVLRGRIRSSTPTTATVRPAQATAAQSSTSAARSNLTDSTLAGNSVLGGVAPTRGIAASDGGALYSLAYGSYPDGTPMGESATITNSMLANAAGNALGGVGGRGLVNDARGTQYNPTLGANVTLSGANIIGSQSSMSENPDISPVPVVGAISVANGSTAPITADPQLGALASNGGPTQTMALLPGSPAIDAATDVVGVTADQRGIARPSGAADIGAYELVAAEAPSLIVTTASDSSTAYDGQTSLRDNHV